MTNTRTETDSFGPLEVPADKYWGAQTQRSIMNFPIGWEKQPVAIVRALGVIKKACAQANKASGDLDPRLADAIIEAKGLKQVSDSGELEAMVDEVIANNAAQVQQYLEADDGKRKKLVGFFVGQVMKLSKGQANPKMVNELLAKKLV